MNSPQRMTDQIAIERARKELLWRQPFVTEDAREKALEYAQAFVEANPQKIEKWGDRADYGLITFYAENYLYDYGVAECPDPKEKLVKLMEQVKSAGWMPNFVMVQAAMLRRALKIRQG